MTETSLAIRSRATLSSLTRYLETGGSPRSEPEGWRQFADGVQKLVIHYGVDHICVMRQGLQQGTCTWGSAASTSICKNVVKAVLQ